MPQHFQGKHIAKLHLESRYKKAFLEANALPCHTWKQMYTHREKRQTDCLATLGNRCTHIEHKRQTHCLATLGNRCTHIERRGKTDCLATRGLAKSGRYRLCNPDRVDTQEARCKHWTKTTAECPHTFIRGRTVSVTQFCAVPSYYTSSNFLSEKPWEVHGTGLEPCRTALSRETDSQGVC